MKNKKNRRNTNMAETPINNVPKDDDVSEATVDKVNLATVLSADNVSEDTVDKINLATVVLSADKPVAVIEGSTQKSDTKSMKLNNFPIIDLNHLVNYGIEAMQETCQSAALSRSVDNTYFYCKPCDYYCNSLKVCRNHIADVNHQKSFERWTQKLTLSVLPQPETIHEKAITELITKEVSKNGMCKDKLKESLKLRKYLQGEIKKQYPDISLLVNGSCLNGFALETSGLDLELVSFKENARERGKILHAVYNIILNNKFFTDLRSTFASAHPRVCCTHTSSGLNVFIGLHNKVSYYTNELLSHYSSLDPRVKTLCIAFRYWAKLCEVDNYSDGSLAPRSLALMVIYFLQRCKQPVLPCLHDNRNDPAYTKPHEMKGKRKSLNKSSVGCLWLEMLRFYTVGINWQQHLIDITSPHYLYRKNRKGNRINIEEPFGQYNSAGENRWMLNHAGFTAGIFRFIQDILQNTCYYFLVPQLSFGSLFCSIENAETPRKKGRNSNDKDLETDNTNDNEVAETNEHNEPVVKITCVSDSFYDAVSWPSYPAAKQTNTTDEQQPVQIENYNSSLQSVNIKFALQLIRAVQKHHLHFRFDADYFTKSVKAPLECSVCHKLGHTNNNCDRYNLPSLCPLPTSYHGDYEELLDHALYLLREWNKPPANEVSYRLTVVEKLQRAIRELYPAAVLELFGSSANGFGFKNSDLDICLTLENTTADKDIDNVQVIKKLGRKLKYGKIGGLNIRKISLVLAAKVPIVKGILMPSEWEIDISCYNVLALRNTKLLSCYAKIDSRVQILGYVMKYVAKICQIGDASRGSLSSYAYVILVIHYLQNCSPPVLPCLQELHSKTTKPQIIVDGWNTWFYDDIDNISKVWIGYEKNNMSVGELWIGLLRYYTETFDWDLNVVSIRQIEPISRLEKMWNTMCIAIEDPFDLYHNLGAGLSRSMSTYIMKGFIRARQVFGAPTEEFSEASEIIDCFFHKDALMDGFPPNDRGCRRCGKVGHIVKSCPNKAQFEDKKKGNKTKNQRIKELPSANQKAAVLSGQIAIDSSKNKETIKGIKGEKHTKAQMDVISKMFSENVQIGDLRKGNKMKDQLITPKKTDSNYTNKRKRQQDKQCKESASADQKIVPIFDQKVATLSEQKVTDQKVSALSDQKVSALSDQKVSALHDKKVAALSDQKVATLSDQKVAALSDQKVAALSDQKVAALSDQKVAELSDQIVTALSDQEAINSSEQKETINDLGKSPTKAQMQDLKRGNMKRRRYQEFKESALIDQKIIELSDQETIITSDRENNMDLIAEEFSKTVKIGDLRNGKKMKDQQKTPKKCNSECTKKMVCQRDQQCKESSSSDQKNLAISTRESIITSELNGNMDLIINEFSKKVQIVDSQKGDRLLGQQLKQSALPDQKVSTLSDQEVTDFSKRNEAISHNGNKFHKKIKIVDSQGVQNRLWSQQLHEPLSFDQKISALSDQEMTDSSEQNSSSDHSFRPTDKKVHCKDRRKGKRVLHSNDLTELTERQKVKPSNTEVTTKSHQHACNTETTSTPIHINLDDAAVPLLNIFIRDGTQLFIDLGFRIYNADNFPKTLLPGTVNFNLPVNNPNNKLYLISLAYTTSEAKEKEAYIKQMRNNPFFLSFVQGHIDEINLHLNGGKKKPKEIKIDCKSSISSNNTMFTNAGGKNATKMVPKMLTTEAKTWLKGTNVPKKELYPNDKKSNKKWRRARKITGNVYTTNKVRKSKKDMGKKLHPTKAKTKTHSPDKTIWSKTSHKSPPDYPNMFNKALRFMRSGLPKLENDEEVTQQLEDGWSDMSDLEEEEVLHKKLKNIFG